MQSTHSKTKRLKPKKKLPMKKIGRPLVLSPEKRSNIIAIISTGCGAATAADYVGCDTKTIRNTAKRDEEFASKLRKSRNSTELLHVRNLNAAGKNIQYWKASTWVLERLFPHKYGMRKPNTVTPEQLHEIIRSITKMIVAEIPVDRYRKNCMKKLNEFLKTSNKLTPPAASKRSRQPRGDR
jgi:hypothetical protein